MQGIRSSKLLWFCIMMFCQTIHSTYVIELATILSRYIKNHKQVGEIAPLSQIVGTELARFVGEATTQGKRYLEAGGGCGAVTICLAKSLGPNDVLDVIEIDPDMCAILKNRLRLFSNVRVQCCSILDWHPDYKYDGIISTLPFNSLGIEFTQLAIQYFYGVAKQDCIFSYVSYPIVGQVLQYFYTSKCRKNFIAVQNYLSFVRKKYLKEQTTIYRNVPPITIYHLCLPG